MKKLLSTGTYTCQWTYRGHTVSGELTLEASRPPAGRLVNAPGTWIEGETSRSFQPHSDDVDVLRGSTHGARDTVLWDSEDVALLGARVQHELPERSWIQAKMALVGGRIPDDMLFDSVEFQVGGLTELSGVRPFKTVTIPRKWTGNPDLVATWNSDETSLEWTRPDGDQLRLGFTAHVTWPGHYSFSVTAAPVMTVSGTSRPAEAWMTQYVRPLAEITTLATQRPQMISWVILRREGTANSSVQVFAADITQQPYEATQPEPADLITHQSAALVRLGPDGAALPDLLEGWATLQTTYITFFDYLTVALRDTMSTRSRFLALVPALEGLHVAKYGDGPMPRAEYRKQRKAVVDRLAQVDGLAQDDIEFIKRWLANYGSHELADRLREIIDKELGDQLRERIKARVDPLPPVLEGIVQNAKDVWAVMGTSRNRIAHGADKQPTSTQLNAITRLAHTVAMGVAMKHLGIPDTVLCEAIDQDRWLVV
ncbi:HEPN domain-containing protein [Kibdelosporangium lantanae]|uniref:HEPN domain-containing protein n=1 Tax=Kibdelosporangium lantanae TaxID=1497396 RepID=A0ABW3M556_9PSEU